LLRSRRSDVRTAVLAFGELFYPQGSRRDILASAGLSSAHISDAVRLLESGAALSELEAVLNPGLGSVPFL
jgi:hypothetical protein